MTKHGTTRNDEARRALTSVSLWVVVPVVLGFSGWGILKTSENSEQVCNTSISLLIVLGVADNSHGHVYFPFICF